MYFTGQINQIYSVQFFQEIFKSYYNKSFVEIFYTIIDKTKENWKLKTRGGRFTESRFSKFSEEVKQTLDKNVVINFELLTNTENFEYKTRDIDISVSYSQNQQINSISVVIDAKNAIYNVKQLFNAILNFLLTQNCKLIYGFVFIMENKKFPIFYARGVKTENLTVTEEDILTRWLDVEQNLDKKVWEIFWGNLLSKKHLNSDLIEYLINILGEENVIQYPDSDLLWFNLPEPLSTFELSTYSNARKQLIGFFQQNDLLT